MVRLEERDRYWVLLPKQKDLGCRAETRPLNPGSNLMTGFTITLEIGLGVIDVVLKELTELDLSNGIVTGRS